MVSPSLGKLTFNCIVYKKFGVEVAKDLGLEVEENIHFLLGVLYILPLL